MKPNLEIVRSLLKKVYVVYSTEPLVLDATWDLSPMGDDNVEFEENDLDHAHLMVERGLLIFSNQAKSNREPGFATIEPTEKAKHWAYCAYDDAKWQQAEDEILHFLTTKDEEEA